MKILSNIVLFIAAAAIGLLLLGALFFFALFLFLYSWAFGSNFAFTLIFSVSIIAVLTVLFFFAARYLIFRLSAAKRK